VVRYDDEQIGTKINFTQPSDAKFHSILWSAFADSTRGRDDGHNIPILCVLCAQQYAVAVL
jgi:hypothetical protein